MLRTMRRWDIVRSAVSQASMMFAGGPTFHGGRRRKTTGLSCLESALTPSSHASQSSCEDTDTRQQTFDAISAAVDDLSLVDEAGPPPEQLLMTEPDDGDEEEENCQQTQKSRNEEGAEKDGEEQEEDGNRQRKHSPAAAAARAADVSYLKTCLLRVDEDTQYRVPLHYVFRSKLGSGAYGTVAAFVDRLTGAKLAIKKVRDVFADLVDARRVLREIRVLRHVEHPNVIKLLDVLPPENPAFEDIYIVTEQMDSDLHRVIYSGQELTEAHVQYFIKQLLFGLRHLHTLGIVHRDVKPSNILTNLDCRIKLCDFGLARWFQHVHAAVHGAGDRTTRPPQMRGCLRHRAGDGTQQSSSAGTPLLTDYVVTRWYRPPEVLLGLRRYTAAVDVWSTGCVLGELLKGEALFKGQNRFDQLLKILPYCHGCRDDLSWLPTDAYGQHARRLLEKIEGVSPCPLGSLVPNSSPAALDLLSRMLRFRPEDRISIDEALRHEYLSGCTLEDPGSPQCSIDWGFDDFIATKQRLRSRMYQDMAVYHPEIIQRDFAVLRDAGLEVIASESAVQSPPGTVIGCLRVRDDASEAPEESGSGGAGLPAATVASSSASSTGPADDGPLAPSVPTTSSSYYGRTTSTTTCDEETESLYPTTRALTASPATSTAMPATGSAPAPPPPWQPPMALASSYPHCYAYISPTFALVGPSPPMPMHHHHYHHHAGGFYPQLLDCFPTGRAARRVPSECILVTNNSTDACDDPGSTRPTPFMLSRSADALQGSGNWAGQASTHWYGTPARAAAAAASYQTDDRRVFEVKVWPPQQRGCCYPWPDYMRVTTTRC